jgi:predicted nucleotide-binding protein
MEWTMGDLINRFRGEANRPRLLETTARQEVVGGDPELAAKFAETGELRELAPGEELIRQGAFDDDLFLILAGGFEVAVNGRHVNVREAGVHVGEQSVLNPSRPRSATVTAREPSLVLRLTSTQITGAVGNRPEFWRRLAYTLQERLEERNRRIGRTNDFPRVFVISSSESKDVAEEVHAQLDDEALAVQVWDQGTFGISEYPISALMDAIEACDFTISIVRADDVLISRGATSNVARDNVHVEYGISLGVLGRRRSILLVCAEDKVKLPSDLTGLTTVRYRNKNTDDMKRSIRTASKQIREHIEQEGVFQDRRGD